MDTQIPGNLVSRGVPGLPLECTLFMFFFFLFAFESGLNGETGEGGVPGDRTPVILSNKREGGVGRL